MAKIPLRAYTKEIENHIERGEIDEAVAHAKNILKSYPKHIDTYRLLGKAFLESQRYSEAADILQRVLSVLPDDFISQIGMSIIREDEGNLDASIWHMERAYEVQPFNPAVQEELRRLYGRRDGIEPPKIRLTRGALVRMYTRGELYPQAIAETRAALAEDPQRLDLLVLLARLYYLSDHKNDAAEVCSELIRKLPYCYEANRLLAEILPSTSRAEEAQKFQQRIFALDPYAAFISPAAPTVEQVPDQAVMVEEFTLDSAMEEAQTPEWTRTIGVEWEETPEEALPDWLNTLKTEQPTGQPAVPPQPAVEETPPESEQAVEAPGAESTGVELPPDELIPDWMKDAGWTPADRTADEIMASQAETENEEIAPAELPDWVQSIAPQDISQAPENEAEERTDWLESILSQSTGTNGKEAGPVPPKAVEEVTGQEEQPDRTSRPETGEQEASLLEAAASDLPDWFTQAAQEQPAESAAGAEAGAEAGATEEESKPGELEGLPDWIQSGETPQAEQPPEPGEVPDWLKSLEPQAPESSESTEQPPDWLQSFETEAEGKATEPPQSTGFTDWLKAIQPEEAEPTAEPSAEPGAEPEVEQEAETPDWLQSLAGEKPASETPGEMLPDWLNHEETAQAPEGTGAPKTPAAFEAATAPETAAPETAAPETVPEFSEMDSAMAWLESLAAKQGADEATLVTPPEQRSEEMPEWLSRAGESQEFPQASAAEASGAEAEAAEAPASEETQAPGLESEAELPEWLQTAGEEKSESSAEITASAPEMTSLPEAGLETAELEATAPEAAAPEAVAPEAAAPEAAPDFSDMDAAMAWLESLAARQGADEATLVTPPEQRLEKPPEWVTKEVEAEATATTERAETESLPAAQEANTPAEENLPPAEEAALPDWLKEALAEETSAGEAPVGEISAVEAPAGETHAAETPVSEAPSQTEAAIPGEMPAEQALETQEAAKGEMDLDSAFAWLESLAAKQGAQEGTLITTPEERLETPPEWVKQEGEAAVSEAHETPVFEEAQAVNAESTAVGPLVEEPAAVEPPSEEPPAAEALPGEMPAAEESAAIPDWLQEIQPTPAQEESLPAQPLEPAEEAIPDWLATIGQEEPAESAPAAASAAWLEETPAAPEEPLTREPLPDWLKEPGALESTEAAPAEGEAIPDWLMNLEEEAEPANREVQAPPSPGEFRSAWEPELEIEQPEVKPDLTPQQAPLISTRTFADVQNELNRGNLEQAVEGYSTFIENGEHLEETIKDLRDALYRYPVDISIWQVLGDAYARNNQLQEALDAYTKAEELLR